MIGEGELAIRFTYHTPKPGQATKYTEIRDAAHAFAKLLDELVPDSREKSLALTHLDDVVTSANAGIARRS